MKPVMITSDSVCDLSEEYLNCFDIKVIPLTVVLGDKAYQDGLDINPDLIYRRYREEGILPKTAAVSPQEFLDFFGPMVEAGYEVVHLDISSKLSGTYQNACIAASELGSVHVIDSRHLSTGMALILFEACRLRKEGKSAREIAEALESYKEKVVTSFVVDTLEFIWKGGRCSGVTALGANLLHIKPCLEMRDGELKVGQKYRGAMARVYRQYIQDLLKRENIDTRTAILTHSGEVSEETLEELRTLIRSLVPFRELYTMRAGCTVSSHCGPGTLGLLIAAN